MAEYAKQAREAGITAAEVGAALKERAAQEQRLAKKQEAAQAAAMATDESHEAQSLRAAHAAKAQGLERLKAGELADAAEAFADAAELGAKAAEGAREGGSGGSDEAAADARAVRVSSLLNEALCRLRLEQWPECEASCARVLALEPGSSKALYRKGTALLRQSRAAEAVADLKAALALAPKDKDIAKALQQAEARLQEHAQAEARAREAEGAEGAEGGEVLAADAAASGRALSKFVAATAFDGARAGYVFKSGDHGLGYYADLPGAGGAAAPAPAPGAKAGGSAGDGSRRRPRLPDVSLRTYAYLDVTIGGVAAGRLTLQLFDDLVPVTVANFRAFILGTPTPSALLEAAAAAAKEGGDALRPLKGKALPGTLSYRGCPFHRVAKGFCVQGGDVLAGDGSGGVSSVGDGGAFADESFAVPHARPGVLSMANMGEPNTNGCQFFLTLAASPECDGKHVAFGRLVTGLALLRRIENLSVDSEDRPFDAVVISGCGTLQASDVEAVGGPERADEEGVGGAIEMGGESLVMAAEHGDLALMRQLIERGVPVDAFGSAKLGDHFEGSAARQLAKLAGDASNAATAATVTADGAATASGTAAANANATDNDDDDDDDDGPRQVDCSALAVASHSGQLDMLRGLLQCRADPGLADSSGRTPLHWAVLAGHTECVGALLGAGGQPAHADGANRSSVHLAASRGRAAVLKLLLANDPASHDARASGLSPLHLAAAGDHVECVDALLEGGAAATVDDAAVGELTPVHLAAAQGSLSALNALLSAGAGATIAGQRSKKQPLHMACQHGRGNVVAALLAAGADANAPDAHGSTPLHWACKAGSRDAVAMLLRAKALPDAPSSTRSTPLHLACEAGSAPCASLLLKAHADPCAADSHGVTPLHAASAVGSVPCVELLFGESGVGRGGGADGAAKRVAEVANAAIHFEGSHEFSGLREKHTKGPLYLASERGHAAVVARLLEAGADVNALATIDTEHAATRTSAVWAAQRAGHSGVVSALKAAGGTEVAETADVTSAQAPGEGQVV